jgi:alpha-L-fucosidase
VEEWLIPFNARHCNLILNVAPNREGRFDQNAADRPNEIGQLWRDGTPAPRLATVRQITAPNLASARPSYASSSADTTGPDLANDDQPGTYWQCDIGQTSGWVEIDLENPTIFDTVADVEPTYLGEYGADSRIVSYRVEAQSGRQWQEVFAGESPREIVYRVKPTSAERCTLEPTWDGQASGDCRVRALRGAGAPHFPRVKKKHAKRGSPHVATAKGARRCTNRRAGCKLACRPIAS